MAVIDFTVFKHVNSTFKVEDIVSLAKSSIFELEANSYPLSNHLLRMIYNENVSSLEDMILKLDGRLYEMEYEVSIDGKDNNLYYSDLSICNFTNFKPYGELFYEMNSFIPFNHIKSIISVYNTKYGVFIKYDFDDLVTIATKENILYKQSYLWGLSGSRIYIYDNNVIKPDDTLKVRVVRRIILDDLKHPKTEDVKDLPINLLLNLYNGDKYSLTYDKYIDVPDRYVNLLNLQMRKSCIEYLGQPIPSDLEERISHIIKNINDLDVVSNGNVHRQ